MKCLSPRSLPPLVPIGPVSFAKVMFSAEEVGDVVEADPESESSQWAFLCGKVVPGEDGAVLLLTHQRQPMLGLWDDQSLAVDAKRIRCGWPFRNRASRRWLPAQWWSPSIRAIIKSNRSSTGSADRKILSR